MRSIPREVMRQPTPNVYPMADVDRVTAALYDRADGIAAGLMLGSVLYTNPVLYILLLGVPLVMVWIPRKEKYPQR